MTGKNPFCEIASPLLKKYAHFLVDERLTGTVVDLACGKGRNGLYLAYLGLPALFMDRSLHHLEHIEKAAQDFSLKIQTRHVDLEHCPNPLQDLSFKAILVFKYLHRPLIPLLKESVVPGGYIFYETFTAGQPCYGRPRNPHFLLKPGELLSWFKSWQILYYFEGRTNPPLQAIAQIVCKKTINHY